MTASPQTHRPHIADADYYRLGYQLAAQLMNRAAAASRAGATAPPPAAAAAGAREIVDDDPLEVALALIEDARTMLAWYGARRSSPLRWRRPTAQEERLQTFLAETIEPCCALIVARRMHQLGREEEAQPFAEPVLRRAREGGLSYRAFYALACLEANTGDTAGALIHLRRALEDAPRSRRAELAQWADHDPAFAPLGAAVGALLAELGIEATAAPVPAPVPPPAVAPPTPAPADEPSDMGITQTDIASLERAVEELGERPLYAAAARAELASAYQRAERSEQAVKLDGEVAVDLAAWLGREHPAALAAQEVYDHSQKLLRTSPGREALAADVLGLRDALIAALADSG